MVLTDPVAIPSQIGAAVADKLVTNHTDQILAQRPKKLLTVVSLAFFNSYVPN